MIRIPNSLFQPSHNDGKLGKVIVYALDRRTIGITSSLENDWASACIYTKATLARRSGSNWVVNLPSPLLRHYLIGSSPAKMSTTINGGRVIIVLEEGGE